MLEERLNCLYIPSTENITKSLSYEERSKENAAPQKMQNKYYRSVSSN
jgi:hypothetical protein